MSLDNALPATDTRRTALLELSMATLEQREGQIAKAIEWGKKARDHLRKLGMRRELEQAEQLLTSISHED